MSEAARIPNPDCMSDTAVRVRELRKRYGDTFAVDGVDLDIARGEVFALLGPNGAGKTTTVEILEGHRRRDAGEISVLGEDPGRAGRVWRSRLGIVLQSATDAAEMTVREMVHHYASYYPRPRDPDHVIELVGLTSKADVRTRNLSGGQRRRVDVAVGVVGNPELVFLDEPTTGFDPAARRQFWDLISRLADEGTTILLTTHYLDEAEALASRVGVLVGGQIVALGEPATLAGRAQAMATVTWSAPDGERSVKTATPTKVVAELSTQFDGEIPELSVTRPSLEDIYLGLIGDQP